MTLLYYFTQMQTDIRTDSFIFRHAPQNWHGYIKLARLDRPIGIWLLLLPGWWSIALASGGFQHVHWRYIILFGLGAVLMRSAGCVVNDLWDRKLDAAVERTRTRPLPSGELTPRQALIFLAALLGLAFLILLQLNALTIALGVFSLLLVAAYPLMKRVTWWPQAFLGLTFNWGALMGWTAVTGGIGLPPVLLYSGGIFWTLAYDTIYAHQDKTDDALIGIKSTARLFGRTSRIFIGACFCLSLLFFAVAKYLADGNQAALSLIALPALHAAWQIKTWDMDKAESCLAVFKSNRDFGFLALLLFATG